MVDGFWRFLSQAVGALVGEPEQSTEYGDGANDEQNLIPATLMREQEHRYRVTAVPSE